MASSSAAFIAPNNPQSHALTDEQNAVVTAVVKQGRNAVVNAVAGSGKTRTALATATQWLSTRPTSVQTTPHVLLLAYNKRLAQDMLVQRDALTPAAFRPFIHVRTIHGLGHRYFGGQGLTADRELSNWTKSRKRPRHTLPLFGLVIVDEAQDLTPVLFDFMYHFLSLLPIRPQLLVLGDPFQLLYRFNGAEESYILDADRRFKDIAADVPFEHFRLSICFRITHEMAAWINENLNPNNLYRARAPTPDWFERHKKDIEQWWGGGIRANPNRPPSPGSVVYHKRPQLPRAQALKDVVDKVVAVFENYDTDSSALLSPFISSNPYSPLRLITNELRLVNGVEQSWFIDDKRESSDHTFDAVRRNKRIASTIHKFKGRESDAIVLVGLDSFPEGIEKSDPRNVFNMFYVGATRARKQLLIVQWSEPAYATHKCRVSYAQDEYEVKPCPITKALEYCPYNETLCEQSPACLQAKTTHTISAVSLSREDYLVSGAHTPQRLSTIENISAIIGLAVEVRLQLLLDDGKLEVPSVGDVDHEMPPDLRKFLMKLRRKAGTAQSYSWAEVLEIATAFLTKTDQLYYRWRQVRNFDRWPLTRRPAKLNEVVRNLVMLLDVVCGGNGAQAMEGMGDLEATVVYEEILTRLKGLRKEWRILFHDVFDFDMGGNEEFVERCSPCLVGEPDIIVLSKEAAERLKKRRAKGKSGEAASDEKANQDIDEGEKDGVTIVEVKATSTMSHDHLLQVGCYGAMHREMRLKGRTALRNRSLKAVEGEIKMPEMFVAYANIGCLRKVELHMDSFEFLHRVGSRKINVPFDARRIGIGNRGQQLNANEPSHQVSNLSQEMPDVSQNTDSLLNVVDDV